MSSCQLMFPGVRSRSRENPMPKGQRTRGVTPRPRSGAVAESARLRQRRNGQEELSHPRSGAVAEKRYPGTRSGVAAGRSYPTPPHPRSDAWPGGATPCQRPGAAAGRTNPMPEARGGGWEEDHMPPRLRPGTEAGRTNPTSKEPWLHGRRGA